MQLHNFHLVSRDPKGQKLNIKKKSKKRVGRGGKRGTYSGKGQKGQKSRAGHRIRPQMRDIIKKLPKKRGYKFKSFQERPVVLNLNVLNNHFKDGDKINIESFIKSGLVGLKKGRLPKIKILGNGDVNKKFLVSECQISKSAKEKIIAAEGSVENLKN